MHIIFEVINCCTVLERRDANGNLVYHYLATVKRQWQCINNDCEETITKCTNGVCKSDENSFKAENLKKIVIVHEIVDLPGTEAVNASSTAGVHSAVSLPTKITENSEYAWSRFVTRKCANNVCKLTEEECQNGVCKIKESATDSPGPAATVTSSNLDYFWSNSKHEYKKCLGNTCTITTKECKNEICDTKTRNEQI